MHRSHRRVRSRRVLGIARLIHVVPAGDPEALRRALAQALDGTTGKSDVAPITETERLVLGWGRYASHHLQLMNELVSSIKFSV